MYQYCLRIGAVFIAFIALAHSVAMGQKLNISLNECHNKAAGNYPLIQQYDLLKATEEYTLSNLSKNYLPQVTLSAQASYQSAVTKVPISVPGMNIPVLSKDQYRAAVDVNQLLWDGGATKAQKGMNQASTEVERKRTEVSMYAIRERVNQLYFGILSVDEQMKQLDIIGVDLQNSLKVVQALVDNGTATASDIDMVRVEQLNLNQRRTELIYMKRAQLEALSVMTNVPLDNDAVLERPAALVIQPNGSLNRPELQLFDQQRALFESQNALINAKNLPKVSLFLQGGYGRPGLNMLLDKFDFFAMGGVRLSWNFGNLYTRKNDQQLIRLNKDQVRVNEETFRFNTNIQLKQLFKEVEKAGELVKSDDEIIALRQKVKLAGEGKYKQGVYTINDYIRDINAENQARQTKAIHEVQYLWNSYNYQTAEGK